MQKFVAAQSGRPVVHFNCTTYARFCQLNIKNLRPQSACLRCSPASCDRHAFVNVAPWTLSPIIFVALSRKHYLMDFDEISHNIHICYVMLVAD